jgi:hypothetical protein
VSQFENLRLDRAWVAAALTGSDTANAQHFQALREAAGARPARHPYGHAYGEIATAIEAAKGEGLI